MDERGAPQECRTPLLEDVIRLCRELNRVGARYLLIGGFAVQLHGRTRTTKDVDFLVDPSPANVALLKRALATMPDGAAADIADTDVAEYGVVRIADEVLVDLLARACSCTWENSAPRSVRITLDGVEIPLISITDLIRSKETIRPSDADDVAFLQAKLDRRPG